jgi:hypothetical protein
MKTFSDLLRFLWRRSKRGKVLQLGLALVVVMFAAGCGKKASPVPLATNAVTNTSDAAQPPTQQPAQNAVTTPVAPPAPPVNLAASANAEPGDPALQRLNQAVIGFRMQNHRNPSSVAEIVSASGIQLPPPPPGKKYAFSNRGLVVLVDSAAK